MFATNLSSLASSIFPTQLSFKLNAKSMYKTNWTKMKMKPAIKPNTYQTVVNGAKIRSNKKTIISGIPDGIKNAAMMNAIIMTNLIPQNPF